jgi:hypothetical protein
MLIKMDEVPNLGDFSKSEKEGMDPVSPAETVVTHHRGFRLFLFPRKE